MAIVVADRRDPELRELFAWRAEASEADYAAGWEVERAPAIRVVLGPDEQALVRFGITVLAPKQLERRYLFAVQAFPVQLARLQVPGTGIWLAPAKAVERAIAREGPQETYAITELCLGVGVFDRAVGSIDEALAHVGSPRESAVGPPMNRAERRAAARKQGRSPAA
ncbi:MAG: hypothetical protein LC720_05055 [Actinobacteria bacterium]|nr:hypothetical protein [Actinomycetota bacterium]